MVSRFKKLVWSHFFAVAFGGFCVVSGGADNPTPLHGAACVVGSIIVAFLGAHFSRSRP